MNIIIRMYANGLAGSEGVDMCNMSLFYSETCDSLTDNHRSWSAAWILYIHIYIDISSKFIATQLFAYLPARQSFIKWWRHFAIYLASFVCMHKVYISLRRYEWVVWTSLCQPVNRGPLEGGQCRQEHDGSLHETTWRWRQWRGRGGMLSMSTAADMFNSRCIPCQLVLSWLSCVKVLACFVCWAPVKLEISD